ncbi:uncharacterized protein LOC116218254 [Clupea harengus]|uniref:Uncharacterized protein LOC116218254 n=1 Tax=Clupea harengus TaxID=7950 RepID=A0A6P8EG87_CLUHA|nr:uncharacterized protein LOC116218254 [Clupea harengus]
MKLCNLFSCCLPMPNEESEGKTLRSEVEAERKRKKQRIEKASKTLSKKKLRKEAKRQKEMADRKRNEVEETRLKNLVMAIPEVQSAEIVMKDMSLDEGKERSGEMPIHHAKMANASTDASEAVVVVSLEMANSSADASPLVEFSKEDCNQNQSSLGNGTPQLADGDGRSPSHQLGDGDRVRPVFRPRLEQISAASAQQCPADPAAWEI